MPEMVIDEEILDDGGFQRTTLRSAGRQIEVTVEGGPGGTLPYQAVVEAMRRYGKPLDDAVVADGPALALLDGITLQRLRFRAGVDACPRDYLVLGAPNEEPVAALSRVIAAALRYLVEQNHPAG